MLHIELEPDGDGRWSAEIRELAAVLADCVEGAPSARLTPVQLSLPGLAS